MGPNKDMMHKELVTVESGMLCIMQDILTKILTGIFIINIFTIRNRDSFPFMAIALCILKCMLLQVLRMNNAKFFRRLFPRDYIKGDSIKDLGLNFNLMPIDMVVSWQIIIP